MYSNGTICLSFIWENQIMCVRMYTYVCIYVRMHVNDVCIYVRMHVNELIN